MAYCFLQRMIVIALILTITIPLSISLKENSKYRCDCEDDSDDGGDDPDTNDDTDIERYLKDLCCDTEKPKQCWKILKPEISRFTDTDSRNVASVIIDLAIAKSLEIKEYLDQQDSCEDESVKGKYSSCSENYDQARHSLEIVKGNLDDCQDVPDQVHNVQHELNSCKREFEQDSFDPANIKDRNKEFGHYIKIVKAATNRALKE